MNDATAPLVAPLARFDFADGTRLTLHSTCLVHSGGTHLETVPLAAIQMLRVGFERNTRRIGWSVTFVIVALIFYAVSGPLSSFATKALVEMATGQPAAAFLSVLYRALEAIASLLPVVAAALAIGAIVLGYLGWRGTTVIHVSLSGLERSFATRGRDGPMLEFAAAVSERLTTLPR